MGIYIEGFGISGFRSFGKSVQRVGPLSKINVFAGQNNSGKSNILLYLMNRYHPILKSLLSQGQAPGLDDIDSPMRDWDETTRVEIGIKHNGEYHDRFRNHSDLNDNYKSWIDNILACDVLCGETNIAWVPFWAKVNQNFSISNETVKQLADKVLTHQQWQLLWTKITNQGSGNINDHWVPQTLQKLASLVVLPSISIIPSVRRYSREGTDRADDYSGLGIINRLARLQNPSYREQNLKDSFSTINNFVRIVTGNQSATLEIPHDRSEILVHMDGKVLPLPSLGTGIHEVIILASAATTLRNQIVCIEEPELHMHPELQKKLIDYLDKETTNQYFITTHSASILDKPNASIFHVAMNEGVSIVTPVSSPTQRFSVCVDLGYRASDLVQANCIIWVEGPSDRIYLKWWINSLDPTLIEGVHYSIMFYGGRLLSHLTANDPEVEEFISLRRLNRNISIIMDSDRKKKQKDINETKKRVQSEFEAGSGVAWITAGREIESYIDRNILEAVAKELHPSIDSIPCRTKYDDPLNGLTKTNAKVIVDKIKLAHNIVQNPVNWEILDLREKSEALIDFIRTSNRLDKMFASSATE